MDMAAPPPLADDLLIGAEAIAEFLFNDRSQRRRVYHLVATSRLPTFHFGSRLAARKSVLLKWIESQESRGWRPEPKIPNDHPRGATIARSPKQASDGGGAGVVSIPVVNRSEAPGGLKRDGGDARGMDAKAPCAGGSGADAGPDAEDGSRAD